MFEIAYFSETRFACGDLRCHKNRMLNCFSFNCSFRNHSFILSDLFSSISEGKLSYARIISRQDLYGTTMYLICTPVKWQS